MKTKTMDKLVSFKIAQLLKEKGFKSKSRYYGSDGKLVKTPDIPENDYRHTNNMMQRFRWEAPTIAEVVLWLDENHNIWIWVEKYSTLFRPYAEEKDDKRFGKLEGHKYKTPIEAYEAVIEDCLNLI